MSLQSIIAEINSDITDVAGTDFSYTTTSLVPAANDPGLSYERGIAKKGKVLNTCVLYVDIRDSVALTEKHHSITMGRIYTAFTKAVIKAARHHHGHTRNIIGDRVMIVFPEQGCFANAVSCAISINHIANNIIAAKFPNVAFKCGIGIDYGELKIIKVGIQRNGIEASENKGLVWTGYPANRASRLTDMANKEITEIYYEVHYYPINSINRLGPLAAAYQALAKPNFPTQAKVPPPPFYSTIAKTAEHTEAEFADCMRAHDSGEIFYVWGKLISFSKKTRKIKFPAILVTGEIMSGLKKDSANVNLYKAENWHEQKSGVRNVPSKIYGSDVTWKL